MDGRSTALILGLLRALAYDMGGRCAVGAGRQCFIGCVCGVAFGAQRSGPDLEPTSHTRTTGFKPPRPLPRTRLEGTRNVSYRPAPVRTDRDIHALANGILRLLPRIRSALATKRPTKEQKGNRLSIPRPCFSMTSSEVRSAWFGVGNMIYMFSASYTAGPAASQAVIMTVLTFAKTPKQTLNRSGDDGRPCCSP